MFAVVPRRREREYPELIDDGDGIGQHRRTTVSDYIGVLASRSQVNHVEAVRQTVALKHLLPLKVEDWQVASVHDTASQDGEVGVLRVRSTLVEKTHDGR